MAPEVWEPLGAEVSHLILGHQGSAEKGNSDLAGVGLPSPCRTGSSKSQVFLGSSLRLQGHQM